MAKEFFAHSETRQLFKTVEDISRRSKVSRAQAFEDVLKACVAALAAETMEPEYFEAIKAHTEGKKGSRGVDLFPVFLGQLVDAMERNDADVLGDLFQGSISYGENGLYLTPETLARLMAELTIGQNQADAEGHSPVICDPCCGTGILLMEAGKLRPRAELVGVDVDGRCARIAAINLGLRGKYGWIICGNSLTREMQFVYRIGSFFHELPNGIRRGVIRQVPPEECSALPEIVHSTRSGLTRQLDETSESDGSWPKIIEVPEWVFQLEKHLPGRPHAERSVERQSPVEETPEEQRSRSDTDSQIEAPRTHQRSLFE